MATLIEKQDSFERFGPSILARAVRGNLKKIGFPSDRLEARKVLRDACPTAPGVYGWLDSNQQLLYVGKSKCLRKRLLSYFAKRTADPKMARIRQHSSSIVWEPISHELLALLREQELIHRWRPEFNSMGQPTRMQPAYLCIGGSPAPNAKLARRLTGGYLHVFGPISGTKKLREAIVSLNHCFQLRDCPDKTKFEFKSQQFLFDDPATAKCIREELGTCPGPCAAMCTANTYLQKVDQCLDFLNGQENTMLDKLYDRMISAAKREAFEVAAIHRDSLVNLTWLDRKLKGLRMADRTLNGILELPAQSKRHVWIVLNGGRIVTSFQKPNTPEALLETSDKLSSYASKNPANPPSNLLEMSLQLIVISWFRKYPELKKSLVPLAHAAELCRTTSNRGQKRSA